MHVQVTTRISARGPLTFTMSGPACWVPATLLGGCGGVFPQVS